MANVGFLLGSQEKVDELLGKGSNAGAINGSFYLTSDTHRLYIGQPDTSIVPVNQGVLSVKTIADLPSTATAAQTGDFYYVQEGNVLCVASGNKWVQINAVKTIQSVTADLSTSDTNQVTVTTTVGVGTSSTDVDTKSGSFKVTGKGSTHVSQSSADGIIVTGDKYKMSLADETANDNKVELKLTSDTAADSTAVAFKGGDNVSVSQADGVITIDSNYTNNDTDTRVSAVGLTAKADQGEGFNLTITTQLHDVLDSDKVVATEPVTATFDPTIILGSNTSNPVHFISGKATLDVYTKEELNETLRALNAMTYIGTVGDDGSAAANVVVDSTNGYKVTSLTKADNTVLTFKVGDTFLVSTDVTDNGEIIIPAGSLLIAKGDEETDPKSSNYGTITSNLSFDIVQGSSNTDTTYKLTPLDKGVALKADNSAAGVIEGSLSVVGGTVTNGASVNVTKTVKNTNEVTLTVTHDTVDAPTETQATTHVAYAPDQASTPITIMTGVTTDATGHLTGYNTEIVDLGQVKASESYSTAIASSNGVDTATISSTVRTTSVTNGTTTYTDSTAASFALKSDSLTLTKTTDTTPTVQVELTWGSF